MGPGGNPDMQNLCLWLGIHNPKRQHQGSNSGHSDGKLVLYQRTKSISQLSMCNYTTQSDVMETILLKSIDKHI